MILLCFLVTKYEHLLSFPLTSRPDCLLGSNRVVFPLSSFLCHSYKWSSVFLSQLILQYDLLLTDCVMVLMSWWARDEWMLTGALHSVLYSPSSLSRAATFTSLWMHLLCPRPSLGYPYVFGTKRSEWRHYNLPFILKCLESYLRQSWSFALWKYEFLSAHRLSQLAKVAEA
jgi:hypothetical protein